MTLNDLREQRNGLLTKMQELALGEKFDTEKRSAFDAMNADVATLETDIARLEAVERLAAEQRSAPRINRDQPGAAIENDGTSADEKRAKEKRAFEQYIRFGHSGVDAEHRAFLRSGEFRDVTTTSGAQLVPQAFYPVLTDALKYYGPISTIVGQKRTQNNGAPMKIALDNDTANSLTVLGETVAVSEVDPTFSGSILSTDTVTTGVVKVSLQELQDSYFDLDSWLRTKFGQRYGRGLEQMITNGNSSNVAALIASGQAVAAVGNGTAAGGTNAGTGVDGSNSIGYDDIVNLYAALDPAYISNATFTMNSNTRGYLLGVKNTFGQPLFVANPSSGAFDTLLGRPVVLNQALPNIAASKVTIQFGDFAQGYLFRTDGDLSILRLNERYMDTLEVGFIGYSRIGGISTDAGTHPIMSLTQAAS